MIAFILSLALTFSLTSAEKVDAPIFNNALIRLVRSKTIDDILKEEAAMREAERAEQMPLLTTEEVTTPSHRTRRIPPSIRSIRTSKKRKQTTPRRADRPPEIIVGYVASGDSSDEELYHFPSHFFQEPNH